MQLYAGTSGYSYKPWKGSFYPEEIADQEMLAYYASRLPAVEINNTFYRMPARKVVERWHDQVPAGFRFVLKAPRRITHQHRLVDAAGPLDFFLDSASALADKLGALLFQLPPYLRKDASRLRDFLAQLRTGVPVAFEFRHPSWFDDEIFDCLSTHGAALCLADAGREDRDAPWVATAQWGYLRLRRDAYDDAALESWAERIRAESWSHAFVFFKHEDAAAGPRAASRLREIFARA